MSILTGVRSKRETRERRKKPDELLSSVVRETAIPAAIELMKGNKAFAFPSETAWAVLLLEAEALGGLSRRHSRDEAKGSLIQLIDSDQIQTLATADMLREEVFGIIPTKPTLERMDEYSLLTADLANDSETNEPKSKYSWAVVYSDGEDLQVDVVAPASFTQAQEISTGAHNLRDILGEGVWARHSGEAMTTSTPVQTPAPVAVEPDVANETAPSEDQPVFDDVVDGTEPVFDEDFDEPVFDQVDDEPSPFDEDADVVVETPAETPVETPDTVEVDPDGGEPEPVYEPDDLDSVVEDLDDDFDEGVAEGSDENPTVEEQSDQYEPTFDPNAEQVADQEQVRSTIARRFLTEDLDLSIGLEEFETSFSTGRPIVQIEVPTGASEWLTDQVAQLVRQANAEMTRLHQAGEAELRAEYVNLMGIHAEQVVKEVATDRSGSVYCKLVEQSRTDHGDRLAAKDQQIGRKQQELREDFDQAAARIAQQAAQQAETQYRERNKARQRRDELEAKLAIETDLENNYTHDQQEILRLRRKDAERKMFLGQTRIFDHVAERHRVQQANEADLLEQWSAKIERTIEQHRGVDMSRVDILAEQQARYNQVEALKAEHEASMERNRAEHTNRLRRMSDELENARQHAVDHLKAREEEWQHTLDTEKLATESQSNRVSDLMKQMDVLGDTFKRQYDDRINEFIADKEATRDSLKRAEFLHSQWSKHTLLIILLVALTMGGVGFVIGGIIGG